MILETESQTGGHLEAAPAASHLQVPQARRRGRPKKSRPSELRDLSRNAVAQDRLKVLALYLDGKYSYQDIAWATGRSRDAVRTWIRAWKSGGMEALLKSADRPARVPHRFTYAAREDLLDAVAEYRWTTAQQAWHWVRDELGIDVCYLTVWRFLASKGLFVGKVMHQRRLDTRKAIALNASQERVLSAVHNTCGRARACRIPSF